MKKFILKLLMFGLVIFLVDKAFIVARSNAPKYDFDRRLEMVLEGNINKDIVILGSSRGESNVDVALLQDYLDVNGVYNLSYGGATVEFQEFVFDKLIEHNRKPKLIIKLLDDDFELMSVNHLGNPKDFRKDRLFPLVKYPEIRQELINQGEKNKILSRLFILHQLNISDFDFRAQGIIDTLYGMKPNKGHNSTADWNYLSQLSYKQSNEDKLEIEYLYSLQKKCFQNGIELIFATSPIFREANEEWIQRMKQLTLPSTLFYEHDLNDRRFREKENFSDFSHMNYKGAEAYTQGLISFILDKNLFLKKE